MKKLCRCNADVFTVISGSFRKHLPMIISLRSLLEKNGIYVLSPQGDHSINPGAEFVILDSDPVNNPEILQSSVFAKMRGSTFLVVANFNGYLGNATILEIGYAIALGIKIYTLESVEDPNIEPYCYPIADLIPGENFGSIAYQQAEN